ncbi:hypothetical protein JYT89_02680 [Flavobacteriaceae bacterium AH-315-B10]|nr:hypothetical protein [Flavobacteriaceae bacterium AH-315-B10]
MKKIYYLLSSIAIIAMIFMSCEQSSLDNFSEDALLETIQAKANAKCATIKGGTIFASNGDLIEVGYDVWGYNYQARMFNGFYCEAYRNAAWCLPYKDVELSMKWNDAWLSNKDCDGDGLLDRYYGFDSYIGSGAWLTNHMKGTYIDVDGNECKWNYFVKIVATPVDATNNGGVWYNADGDEIGSVIWGAFAIIQVVENDPCAGINGKQYGSPVGPGFGKY